MLSCKYRRAPKAKDWREESLTEQEWQKLERTMRFIVERHAAFEAKFEASFDRADRRFEQAEKRFEAAEERIASAEIRMDRWDKRMDRLERFAERAFRAADLRMAKAEAEMAELRADMRLFLRAMRRSAGNGRGRT